MTIGPTVRRRRLGSELRRLREAQSIKLEEVAEQLGLAPSTLSRIETGKAPTRSAYLTTMLDIYGVDDPVQKRMLVDMAREGHRKGWWAVWEDALPTGFGIYVGLEAEAASLRVYEAQVVHGLLQTEEYARTVMTTVRRRQTPAEIDHLVRLRMRRQEALYEAGPAGAVDHPGRGRDPPGHGSARPDAAPADPARARRARCRTSRCRCWSSAAGCTRP